MTPGITARPAYVARRMTDRPVLEPTAADPITVTPTGRHVVVRVDGAANYYHVSAAGHTVQDAIWTYEQPFSAVAAIAGHVAFYADKADVTVG